MANSSQDDEDRRAEYEEMGAWINTQPHFFWAHLHVAGVWFLALIFAFLVKIGIKVLLLSAAWHCVSIYLLSNNLTIEEVFVYAFNRLQGGIYISPPDIDRWKVEEEVEATPLSGRVLAAIGLGKK